MLFTIPVTPRSHVITTGQALNPRDFTSPEYTHWVATTGGVTHTMPTPVKDLAGFIMGLINDSSGNVTFSGTFLAGTSMTLATKQATLVVCMPLAGTTYKWMKLSELGASTELSADELAGIQAGAPTALDPVVKVSGVPVKATGAAVDIGTNDTDFLTPKAIEDSSYAKTSAIPTVATGAEVNTGTDNAKMVTAKAMADSDYAKTSDIPDASAGFDYVRTGRVGGTANDLDGIAYALISDGEKAWTNTSGSIATYHYDATSAAAESDPTVIKPDDAGASNGRWLIDTVNLSMISGLVNANVAAGAAITEAKLALNYATHSNANDITVYADLTAAELATSVDGKLCWVKSLDTFYEGLAAGGAFTRDATYVLNTADAGDTRWIGYAGLYVYHTLNVSDGTNKAAVTATMMKGIENAAISATDIPAKASSTGILRRYADLTAAELATSVGGLMCFVISLGTLYEGLASAAAYTRDGTFVLNTADAGDTRWVGRSGKYVYNSLESSDGTNKAALTASILKGLENGAPTPTDPVAKMSNAPTALQLAALPNYEATALTGGGAGALDLLATAGTATVGGEECVVTLGAAPTQTFARYRFLKTGVAAESSPDVIRPDDFGTDGQGNWNLVLYDGTALPYGTAADTVCVGNDTRLLTADENTALTGSLNWGDWSPTIASVPAVDTTVARYQRVGNSVSGYADVRGADGDAWTPSTFSLPVAPVDLNARIPCQAYQKVGAAAKINMLAEIDAETGGSLNIKFNAAIACTNAEAWQIQVHFGPYEVSA
ncbi:MAG: hypothetical protein WC891_08825 [Actinomycetota bacterium]